MKPPVVSIERLIAVIGWSVTLLSGFVFLMSTWILQERALGSARLSSVSLAWATLGVALGGSGLILARLGSHWLHIHLGRPLVQLRDVLNALQRGGAKGDLPYTGSVRELGDLSYATQGVAAYLRTNIETLQLQNDRSREAYATMLIALEDTAAIAEQLRSSERRYRELAEAVPLMVWTASPTGEVDFCNARWVEYTGIDIAALEGWGWQQIAHPDDRPAILEAWQHALRSGTYYQAPCRMRAKDGTYRMHVARAVPVKDEHGRVQKWIGATIDVEDQKRAAELERTNAELQEMDRLKDQFLSVVSHELRTPINAIMGFGSILDDELAGPLNMEQHRYLRKLLAGADLLLNLVNDLLDMSRIQAGKFELRPRAMAFPELVRGVLDQLAPLADQRHHRVVDEVPNDLPPMVADDQRIAQVLVNLLSNAFKFTPDGGTIRVRACLVEGDPFVGSPPALRCEVTDTGPGISKEDASTLFQPFRQLDMTSTRQVGGTGLGLSISRALITAHRGEIGVDSEPGCGSTFWFTVPLAGPGP